MNTNLDLIKRIISNDDMCDKVNSMDCKDTYISQVKNYVLSLIKNYSINDIPYIVRYIDKFVIDYYNNPEDMFFDSVVLSVCNMNDLLIQNTLKKFDFFNTKDVLFKRYEGIIKNNSFIDDFSFNRMFLFYYYVCNDFIMPTNYVDYFIGYVYKNSLELSYDFLVYLYKQFSLSYSKSQGVNLSFSVVDFLIENDPYYDNKNNEITVFRPNIGSTISKDVIADIFYQIKYLYLVNCINNSNNINYSYEQLLLVKELSLVSILGDDYYYKNYGNISYKNILKSESYDKMVKYFSMLGINVSSSFSSGVFVDSGLSDDLDKVLSIDLLFNNVLKRENPNLIRELVRNYPVLGIEYKNNRRKNMLDLLIDIYNNKRLVINLNKDLEWHNKRNSHDDEIEAKKVLKLNNKLAVCNSCNSVMNSIINNSDYSSFEILDSVFALITYNTKDLIIKSDIITIVSSIVPNKISKLCEGRNDVYINDFKKRFISCFLDALGKVDCISDISYFMNIYECFNKIILSFKS